MKESFDKIPKQLFDQLRPNDRPSPDRIRFTPTKESSEFLNTCKEYGYDISTIINLAIYCFKPKVKPDGYTWEGIESVI